MAGDFSYEVVKKIGKISDRGKDTLELRLISYGGREAKYDIRTWYTDENGKEKMGKGITLNSEEAEILKDLLTEEF